MKKTKQKKNRRRNRTIYFSIQPFPPTHPWPGVGGVDRKCRTGTHELQNTGLGKGGGWTSPRDETNSIYFFVFSLFFYDTQRLAKKKKKIKKIETGTFIFQQPFIFNEEEKGACISLYVFSECLPCPFQYYYSQAFNMVYLQNIQEEKRVYQISFVTDIDI